MRSPAIGTSDVLLASGRLNAPEPIDPTVESLCREEHYDEATTLILERHGPEILGLLVSIAGDEAVAADGYSVFCEQLWRSLPKFRFESTVRTWAYVLARRALVNVRRRDGKGPPMQAVSPSRLPELVEDVRSATRPYLKTTHKDALAAVRASLSDDDQMLLVLRLDRALAWDEIARVLGPEDADAPTLQRTAVALRKRFSRAKQRLAAQLQGRTKL